MRDPFLREIEEKLKLIGTIETQMADDVAQKVISGITVQHLHTAKESFKAAQLHLSQDKEAEAIYLFSRGCWNMGEFIGRSKLERAAH